MTISGGEVML